MRAGGVRLLQLSPEQAQALRQAMHQAPKPHVRRKATAIWNLAQGRSRKEVAAFLDVSGNSLSAWVRRYQREGLEGFALKPGRGRPPIAQAGEIESLFRQSPRTFGLDQTRWTLSSLARVAPSLKGFTPTGVRMALRRSGFSYKRGQPHLHSPDQQDEAKRGDCWQRFEKSPPAAESPSCSSPTKYAAIASPLRPGSGRRWAVASPGSITVIAPIP